MTKKPKKPVEPFDFSKITIPAHRPETEIIQDLERLCISQGYAHALAFLCWRDNFISFSQDELVPADLDKMKSWDRLLRSELSFLNGLMVKAPINVELPTASVLQHYIDETDKLMAELHDAMKIVFWSSLKETGPHIQTDSPVMRGMAMREPFFYSGESAYLFQYRDFAPERYKNDEIWLQKYMGFTPNDVKNVIEAIDNRQLEKLQSFREKLTPETMENFTLLPAFTFDNREIAEASGRTEETVKKIMAAFSPKSLPCNQSFKEVGAFNEINAYPILPINDGNYLLLQNYNFAESAYETPAFWMGKDDAYAETAKKNRGLFAEKFSANRLRQVLGTDHVYENVYIMRGKKRVGEIDVLAIYADRAIILQAKSKKLTEAAKKGNDEAIRTDFQKAIQDAYDQGFKCASLIGDTVCRITDEQGNSINIRRDFAEIFIFCVVSEYYPALAHQADHSLQKKEHEIIKPPYVMDVFFLDVLCEMLDSPLQFFNFLHRRLNYAGKVKSENELAILSFHLAYNLWFKEDFDYIDLGDDFAVHIDAAMLARREGLPAKKTPEGILTKLKNTFFDRILQQICALEQDNIIELGYFLLELSEESAKQLSQGCEMIVHRTNQDGGLHDVSLSSGRRGITVHCGFTPKQELYERLYVHCELAKYRQKADIWFGLALNSAGTIQLALGLKSSWKKSTQMDQAITVLPNSRYKNLQHALSNSQTRAKKKIGVNKPCICGSGKKYKKCCMPK